jgi:cyclophilin family peptidyl-prolyl cis-trans isomerase
MKLWQQLLIVLAGLGLIIFFTQLKDKPTPMPDTPSPTPAPTGQIVNDSTERKSYSQPPPMSINPDSKYAAVLETSHGQIAIELLPNQAPITVNNFVFLAQEGFYNDTVFHRIIKDFMIQGGDPTSTGSGGPGYQFSDEPINLNYDRGVVAMANSGPDTNGSQFFIMHKANYELPKNYVIFGQVANGHDTLDTIAEIEVEANQFGELSKPKEEVKLIKVTIQEIPKGEN